MDLTRQQIASSNSDSANPDALFSTFVEKILHESASGNLSVDGVASPSASTIIAPQTPGSSRSESEGSCHQKPPICTDPDCLESIQSECEECCEDCSEACGLGSICDVCSDYEEWCEDCFEHGEVFVANCGSACSIHLDADTAHQKVHDDYSFPGSHYELFGDQAAEVYGIGTSLPQLSTDTLHQEASGFDVLLDDAEVPALGGHDMPGSSYAFNDQSRVSLAVKPYPPYFQLLEAAELVNTGCTVPPAPASSLHDEQSQSVGIDPEVALGGISPTPASLYSGYSADGQVTAFASPSSKPPDPVFLAYSTDLAQDSAVVSLPTKDTKVQDSEIALGNPALKFSTPPSIQCQWVDCNGQLCGRVFAPGDDMFEHLKAAHGVRNDVSCRWLGCHLSVFGLSPHRFANSVERHIWGHSWYRPYKCLICSEGFAAAKIRDEHFANVHLRTKMFRCDICPYQCASAPNLRRHKEERHTTERFQCEFCLRHGKTRLFSRGSNLARHFRRCKCVLGLFPEAPGAATGKLDEWWFPTGYKVGRHGMDRAKITALK